MSDLNTLHNRAVWIDIPVANLDRAADFYAAVLNIRVHKDQFNNESFGVLEHEQGNGGCLIVNPAAITQQGILVYLNVHERIQDAVAKVEQHGGKVLQPIHPIGPHGFRTLVLDSEGNRLALHSQTDT